MTLVAAGNTNPVTLISYSFVCLRFKTKITVVQCTAGLSFVIGNERLETPD